MQQPQFSLAEKDVQFTHMNTRTEKHGEDDVLAVDLDMMISCGNDQLAMLHPTLKWSLYDKPDVGNSDLADQALADQLIRLRYPKLATLRWDLDMLNCEVTFHYGVTNKRDIKLTDCKVNKLKIECHDGGTIELAWRVQANPTHEQIGRLSERLSTGVVSVSIEQQEAVEAKAPATNTPELNPLDKAGKAGGKRDHGADDENDGEDDQEGDDLASQVGARAPAGRRGRRSVPAVE